MKKNTVALLLSVVLAAGSIGAVPVRAAETIETASQESVEAQADEEDYSEELKSIEGTDCAEAKSETDESESYMESDTEVTDEATAEEEQISQEDAWISNDAPDQEKSVEEPLGDTDELTENMETEATSNDPEGTVVQSGTCGENLTWVWDNEGILTISGTGPMADYNENEPWRRLEIQKVIVENGVTSIGNFAFNSHKKLKSVELPASLIKIGKRSFSYCESLPKISIPDGVTSIGTSAFLDCVSLTSVKIPSGVTSIENNTFADCKKLEKATLPDGVTRIGESAFRNCFLLKDINIPDGVTIIEFAAFASCESLTSVTIPKSVETIESDVFEGCEKLANLTIMNGVKNIGSSAFKWCYALTDVTIPGSVDTLSSLVFNHCTHLETVTIYKGVNKINEAVFEDCPRLSTTYYIGTQNDWLSISVHNSNPELLKSNIIFVEDTKDLKYAAISGHSAKMYTGSPITPSPVVKQLGVKLTNGTDYTVSYSNNTKVGTATVKITGKGSFKGSTTATFLIVPGASTKVNLTNVASGIKISWNKVTGAKYYKVYRGTTYLFTTSQLYGTDTWVKPKNGFKYTYKVVASITKNDASGDSPKYRTATGYRLIPVGIKSLSNQSGGKMTVTYDANYQSSGYVVRYGLKSDMSDAKVITVKGVYTTSRTFSGLTKGKTYYVQVRTYKLDNGVRYYSGYCTTKTIKIVK